MLSPIRNLGSARPLSPIRPSRQLNPPTAPRAVNRPASPEAWLKAQGGTGDLAATVRAGAINGVRYETTRGPDLPVFRGTVVVTDGKAQLETPNGAYELAGDAKAPWNLRWSAELASFAGQVVTVRGQPSLTGKALMVKEFAPGTSDQFVQGRVFVKDDGVYINVRPGKQVKVMDPALAASLADWERVAMILPGPVEYSEDTQQWRYLGSPDSVYLLTKLNPGEGVYFADTPFERVRVTAAKNLGGVLPNEKMGQRIFVHGKITKNPAPGEIPNRRFFEADWIGDIIRPELVAHGEELSTQLQFADALVTEAEPAPKGLRAAFEPKLPELPRGTKTGQFMRPGTPPMQERWFEGRKLAEGPLDAEGRQHGEWREFSAVPVDGTVNEAGEAPYRYVETLRGEYKNGRKDGVWQQLIDGHASNAWQWDNGKLLANGHLDAEGRQHDAWTLVAADGFRDGGEGVYKHGMKTYRWNWYVQGTTDYERAELYHPNGQLAAKGAQRGVRGDDGIVRTYRSGPWEFFDADGKALGTVTYAKDQTVDVEQLGPLGNGATFSWDSHP